MSTKANPAGLVEYISRNLVKNKDDVQVNPVNSGSTHVVELHVHKEDLGTVIGKNGRIARAMRTLLSSISTRRLSKDTEQQIQRINLEIVDQ